MPGLNQTGEMKSASLVESHGDPKKTGDKRERDKLKREIEEDVKGYQQRRRLAWMRRREEERAR